jgi:drug/metabolite transporter (DMT)-like permease/predicted  nucleic acid-binding Zn-ribbon protein
MGLLDNQSENTGTNRSQPADDILRSITQDLRHLQQDLVVQLTQDIGRLQTEKARLIHDIEHLKNQHELLQTQHQAALSRQQVAQQQQWAKQLAQALAVHIQKLLEQQLAVSPPRANPGLEGFSGTALPSSSSIEQYNANAHRFLNSLDSTLNTTLQSLEKDLGSYHSALSQQLARMHSTEKQGEAILDALVARLSQQLQTEIERPQSQSAGNGHGAAVNPPRQSWNSGSSAAATSGSQAATVVQPAPTSSAPPQANGATAPPQASRQSAPPSSSSSATAALQRGMVLIIFSTIALSLHNIIVGLIGFGGNVFGTFPFDRLIELNIPNSILVLSLRMLVVVPSMAFVASYVYPAVWRDIRDIIQENKFKILIPVLTSGLFLFLSQVSIYTAISQIGPGVAVTILFMYPLVTVPLAWLLFGDRPTWLRVGVMVAIALGIVLAALPNLTVASELSFLGLGTAVFSGIMFAFYLIFTQVSFQQMHPVPASLVQFSTIFVLAWVFTIAQPGQVEPGNVSGLLVAAVVLGIFTLIGYLLNNFGIRLMGAARASIIASSGPVLTAVLAFLLIPGDKTALNAIQVIGIVLVTIGVSALAFERMLLSQRKNKPAKQS